MVIMILKIRSLCQFNADNLYKKQKGEHHLMLPPQPQLNDYYGYNSIINCEGKRVRRMRRTQASVEKLLHSRMKSPVFSRSASSRKSRVERNDKLVSNSRSSAKITLIHNKIQQKQLKTEPPSEFGKEYEQGKASRLQASEPANRPIKDVKSAMGQYYIGSSSVFEEKSAKKQQSSKPQSKISIKQFRKSNEVQIQNNFKHISINTSKRTLKKTQKSQDYIVPFVMQNNKKSKRDNKEVHEKILLKKRQSNLRQNSQRSNKLSKLSVRSKEESLVSNESHNIQVNVVRKNHVKFEENESYVSQSSKRLNETLKISKKSSINIHVSSEVSSFTQKQSNISAYASKLKSKIQERKEKSKISIKEESEVNVQKMVKSQSKKAQMAKKLTQTTESPSKQSQIMSSSSNSQSSISNNKQQVKIQSNSHSQRQSEKQIPKIIKKKSISSYTFNDVVQNIQQHEIRLGSLFFFIDSTKARYESPIKFERYERLCFLILKKYVFEQNRLIKCLKGGQNCFVLTNAQVPAEVLKKHMYRQQVRDRLGTFVEQSKQMTQALIAQYNTIIQKYPKDKYIRMQIIIDNFSPEIMRLLMEQLTKLYQQLQGEDIENDIIDANQQRIIEIIQIMFLMSELSGRPVKQFQLFDENIRDFEDYYSQNYERIMETAQYFEKYV